MTQKIRRLELAVHLFDDINFRNGELYTRHHENYDEGHEDLMTRKYIQRIDELSKDPESYLLFIAHSPINKGELHANVRDVYMHVLDKMPDRHTRYDFSINPETVKGLGEKISQDVVFGAWGEYTSGCVLNDLLRLKHALGKNIDYETTLKEICPESGIDFVYPRPWESSAPDLQKRINMYQHNVAHNIQYFFGEKELPAFN